MQLAHGFHHRVSHLSSSLVMSLLIELMLRMMCTRSMVAGLLRACASTPFGADAKVHPDASLDWCFNYRLVSICFRDACPIPRALAGLSRVRLPCHPALSTGCVNDILLYLEALQWCQRHVERPNASAESVMSLTSRVLLPGSLTAYIHLNSFIPMT